MSKLEYHEPIHVLLDWGNQNESLSTEEYLIIDNADRQIEAYMGRFYGDIRQDIINCALEDLEKQRTAKELRVAGELTLRIVHVEFGT